MDVLEQTGGCSWLAELGWKKLPRVAIASLGDFFGGANCNHITTAVAAFWALINDPVG